jgi:4-hydroxy-tetrahydrodipicolinate synthase
MAIQWQGIFAVLVTPFKEDLSIDFEVLEHELAFCLDCGVNGLAGPLIAGEFHTLSDRERIDFYRQVSSFLRGRVPFLAGVSGVSASHAAELAKAATNAGADALVAMPPYIVPNTPQATIAYYQTIAKASPLPIMVQNAPAPFSSPLSTQQLSDLLKFIPSIEAIKEETAPNPQQIGRLIEAAGGRLRGVFGGMGGIHLFNELSRGSSGTMPACEFADVVVDIYQAYSKGALEVASQRFQALQPALVMEGLYWMRFMKYCLVKRGIFKNTLTRTPEPDLDAYDVQELERLWPRLKPFFRV